MLVRARKSQRVAIYSHSTSRESNFGTSSTMGRELIDQALCFPSRKLCFVSGGGVDPAIVRAQVQWRASVAFIDFALGAQS